MCLSALTVSALYMLGFPLGARRLAFAVGLLLQRVFLLPQDAFRDFHMLTHVNRSYHEVIEAWRDTHCWGQGWLGGKDLMTLLAKGKRIWF